MKLSLRHIVYYRMLLFISLVVITYLATTSLEITVVSSIYDKTNHFVAFLILSLLLDFSFPYSRFNTAKIYSLFMYGCLIEIIQYFLPHRMFSLLDIVADSLGLLAYGLLIPFIKRIPAFSDRWSN